MTPQDLQRANSELTNNISQFLDTQTNTITAQLQQSVNDAYHNGRDKTYQDLEQKLTGQQSRIDAMTADKTAADRMASADHALLEQLKTHFASTMAAVSSNTDVETKLIKQMQKAIKIDGSEVVTALEAKLGQSVKQLLNQQVAQYIHAEATAIHNDKAAIVRSNQRVMTAMKRGVVLLAGLLLLIGAMQIVPWWQVRLTLAVIGFGGAVYGVIKQVLD